MKKISLALLFVLGFLQVHSQKNTHLIKLNPKLKTIINKISISANLSTSSFGLAEINQLQLRDFRAIDLGEITVAYKWNNRFSFGISSMSTLNNRNSGYFDGENQFVPFCAGEDGDSDGDDDGDSENSSDNDHECDDDDDLNMGQNVMGTISMKLSDKLPFFLQASGGYSFSSRAPAYTAKIGYNQNLFAGLGLSAGIRFSDVLYKRPVGATRLADSSGLKAELGFNWNF